jgi:hypothetical protein
MKTSWRYHRPHAVANLAFRAATVSGFGGGIVYAGLHASPGTPSCDVQKAECLASLIRYEAIYHVAPPVGGLLAGTIAGAWLARLVHDYYRRARTA